MLVCGDCFIVPEACLPVGMTERLKEQKKIFREVASHQNSDAPVKIKEAVTMVKNLMGNSNCIERMKEWRFFVDQDVKSF